MHYDPKQVKSIFLTALEKATREERAAFLGAACGGEGDLRRRVDELLSAHEEPGEQAEVLPVALQGSIRGTGLASHHSPLPKGMRGMRKALAGARRGRSG